MKRILTLLSIIALSIILKSCAGIERVPLKSKYENPNTFYFDKSFDEVWNATIKVVMRNGFSIKFLEKASGVIAGERVDLYQQTTIEDEKGQLTNKSAFAVSEKQYNGYNYFVPSNVNGSWNILVYQENGKTALNVNLVLDAKGTTLANQTQSPIYYKVVSTGNFEKLIADSLKF